MTRTDRHRGSGTASVLRCQRTPFRSTIAVLHCPRFRSTGRARGVAPGAFAGSREARQLHMIRQDRFTEQKHREGDPSKVHPSIAHTGARKSASTATARYPMPAPHDFWTVLQKMGPDFDMSLGFWAVCCGRGSLQTSPTWGNADAPRPSKPKPPAKPPRSRMARARGTSNERGHRAQTVARATSQGTVLASGLERGRRTLSPDAAGGRECGCRRRAQTADGAWARDRSPSTERGQQARLRSRGNRRARTAARNFFISPLACCFDVCYFLKHPRVARPASWQIGIAPIGVADAAAVHRIFPYNLISDVLRVAVHASLLPVCAFPIAS